ncbi:MAG: hypothetical protein WBP45_10985 [Daejeonella sp.]
MKLVCSVIIFISINLAFQAWAQSGNIKGVIFEKGSSARVPQARINNINRSFVSQSDGLGLFAINAFVGDTLKISKEGFTDVSVVVSSSQDMVIQLAKPIQLNEVRVIGQSKKKELDEVKKQYRSKGSYYGGKPPLLSFVFTPITALYELFGKTPARARRFNKYYYRELQQSEIDRRFNSYAVKSLTQYEGNDLQNFMDLYRPDYDQLSRWNNYDLINYIRKSALTFDAAGRPSNNLPKLPKAPDLSEKIIE